MHSEKLDNLLQREITRREFLRYTGLALLSIVGISGFLKHLHDNVPGKSSFTKASGYGNSAYGR